MPRSSSFPQIIDYAKTISISDLKKRGCFSGNNQVKIIWRTSGVVNITLHSLHEEDSYIELFYFDDGEKFSYKVQLIKVASNLGRGYRYYFICPVTFKKCIKLYKIQGTNYFLHREVYKGALYERQAESKKNRAFVKYISDIDEMKKFHQKVLFEKHTKTYYNDQPTKKLKKYFKIRDRVANMDINELLQF